jgi:hypothetical protein
MTVFNDHLDEYLWIQLYMQGNVNVPGLIFDDLLYEYMDLIDTNYTVNVDLVESGFNLAESFDPLHLMMVEESFDFSEVFGFPSRIKQVAINVIHEPVVSPVDLCHMQIDIVQGVDIFWDEVSDGLYFPTESDDVAKVAMWFFGWCYESLDMDFEMAEGTPGVTKSVFPFASDNINSRHEIEARWEFNNKSTEQLFTYDSPGLGWQQDLSEGFVITDNVRRYLGFTALDHLFMAGESSSFWTGIEALKETFFTWDISKGVNGWDEQALEALALSDEVVSPFLVKILEDLVLDGSPDKTVGKTTLTVAERIKVQETAQMISSVAALVSESFKVTDSFSTAVTRGYNEALQDGFAINVDAIGNMILVKLIEEALTHTDSPLIAWFMDVIVNESLSVGGEIN